MSSIGTYETALADLAAAAVP